MKVGIVGVGLIGGSIAKALALQGVKLFLDDRDPATQEALQAQRMGLVAPWQEWAGSVDQVVVSVPLERAAGLIEVLSSHLGAASTLVDVGSVKTPLAPALVRASQHVRVLSLHVMAGRERSGFDQAAPDLFSGRPLAVVDVGVGFPEEERAVWWQHHLGTERPSYWTAADHDAAVAWVSQLPYVASRSLKQVVEKTLPKALLLQGPGFRDSTRVGTTPIETVNPMLISNREQLSRALLALESEIRAWRECLDRWDGGKSGVLSPPALTYEGGPLRD